MSEVLTEEEYAKRLAATDARIIETTPATA